MPIEQVGSGPHGAVRGVGICLAAQGAVVAVVWPDPPRLAALASVSWTTGVLRPTARSGASATARRALVKVRRRLRLPRWCAVAVVVGPSLANSDVLPRSAYLLARAGLVQSCVTTPDHATRALSTMDLAVASRLARAVAEPHAGLAVAAAAVALLPGTEPLDPPATGIDGQVPVGAGTQGGGRAGAAAASADWIEDAAEAAGWSVQPIEDDDSSAAAYLR